MRKKRINSNWYTKGKFGNGFRETLDRDNELLYSKGRYPTKLKVEDLPDDYVKFQSRTIWYLTGYLKTSGVKDLYYSYMKINHLFKDDYLDISYNDKIKVETDEYGFKRTINYDFTICGNDIIPVLFAIEKNSSINTTAIRKKIAEKFEWWKEHEKDDYERISHGEEINDIFEYYKKLGY